jgi:hypothetical protein
MSEDKAIASIHTIFGKVQKDFPLVAAITNLSKKLVTDIRDKIADVKIGLSSAQTSLHRERKIKDLNLSSNPSKTKVVT